jgi:hypothetical protein
MIIEKIVTETTGSNAKSQLNRKSSIYDTIINGMANKPYIANKLSHDHCLEIFVVAPSGHYQKKQ